MTSARDRTSPSSRFPWPAIVLASWLLTGCGGGGGGGGGAAAPIAGEVYQLTEHRRIDRLIGYGFYKDAWKDDDPSTQTIANCWPRTQPRYDQPGVPYFRNPTDCAFGMDLGFPTPIRGYPNDAGGRLYFFFGDTDPLDKAWLDSNDVVAKVRANPTMSESTVFGETPHQLGTVNGDSIAYVTDADPSDGLDIAHLLRNTEGANTQYDTATTGVLANAFRSTVTRLEHLAGSGPTYDDGGQTKHRQGMGPDFVFGVDVPGGILYLDNRDATDPAKRKEYLFNFRWYQPHQVLLKALGVKGDIWKADYMLNSFTTIAVSTDLGLTWNALQQRKDQWPKPFSGWDPGAGTFKDADWTNPVAGKFLNVAFLEVSTSEFDYLPANDPDVKARASDGRYVLIFGYGVAQTLELYLACVPRERLIELADAYATLGAQLEGVRYFGGLGSDGKPLWKQSEADAIPVCWISHPKVRETIEAHCTGHSDPAVKIQIVEESVGGAWTLSVQRVRASFYAKDGKLVDFDRLIAVVDFGYSALVRDLKQDAAGKTPATVQLAQLSGSDHEDGDQASAQPGPALFTADPRYPWAWNVEDPTALTADNIAQPRPFEPLFLPKAANDVPIVDNAMHDIGDAPGSICGIRRNDGFQGGPHDDWTQRVVDPYDATKAGSEFVGSPFVIGCLAKGIHHSSTTKAGVLLYLIGVHYGYAVDLFSVKLTRAEW